MYHAYTIATSHVWNELLPPITSASSRASFIKSLNTEVFCQFLQRGRIAYNSERSNTYGVCPSVHLSVCPSHAGTLSRRMNIESRGLHCEIAKHPSFLTPTMVGGDVPFHLKFALKMTHPPLKSADFDQYLLITSQP